MRQSAPHLNQPLTQVSATVPVSCGYSHVREQCVISEYQCISHAQGSIIRKIRGPLANIRESIRGIRRIFV
jgi:hypothetical protein